MLLGASLLYAGREGGTEGRGEQASERGVEGGRREGKGGEGGRGEEEREGGREGGKSPETQH